MENITLTFLLLFVCCSANKLAGQKNVQGRIDSLEAVLKKATDTSRIKILLELCSSHQQKNPNNVPPLLRGSYKISK